MARWHRWTFEVSAPADDFVRGVQRALAVRGVHVEPAARFDFAARAFGARAYAHVAWVDQGLEMTLKVKGGLFSAPVALERLVLEASQEAQARLAFLPGDTII
ncbi:MAG TPA: hypothetical protein VHH36_08985 [Candidatus Thermoplasmatota archaeon]|nr:hypothetical protein [Candidatus Thermoplasmatota archaeon]